MIVLDTNVISEIMRIEIDHRVEEWFGRQMSGTLWTTAISLAEIALGMESLPEGRRKSLLRGGVEHVSSDQFEGRIIPFDERAARAYGQIVAQARSRGRSIQIADGQIAAIAKVHGFTVATRDTSPFEAAGVSVVDPWSL
jgi:predicted nucleic acid-binding protein